MCTVVSSQFLDNFQTIRLLKSVTSLRIVVWLNRRTVQGSHCRETIRWLWEREVLNEVPGIIDMCYWIVQGSENIWAQRLLTNIYVTAAI